jgi:hypothetical protein
MTERRRGSYTGVRARRLRAGMYFDLVVKAAPFRKWAGGID